MRAPSAVAGRRLHYMPALDGVRALSVLSVIIFHYGLFLSPLPGAPHWLTPALSFSLGVQIFFVLSGALITSLLVSEFGRAASVSLRAFYLRRWRRLGPALAILVPLVVAAELVWNGSAASAPLGAHPWLAVTSVALFVGNWVQFRHQNDLGWLGPTWSLGIEEQFYLSWPMALRLFLRRRLPRAAIMVGLAVALVASVGLAALCQRRYGLTATHYATPTQLPCLIVGCALGYEITANPHGAPTRMLRSPVVGAIGLIGAVFTGYEITRHVSYLYRGGYLPFAMFGGLLIGHCFVAADRQSLLTRLLACPPLRIVGKVSYEIYLVHVIVILAMLRLLPRVHALPMLLLDTAVITLASGGLYRFIDQPIRRDGWRAAFSGREHGAASPRAVLKPARPFGQVLVPASALAAVVVLAAVFAVTVKPERTAPRGTTADVVPTAAAGSLVLTGSGGRHTVPNRSPAGSGRVGATSGRWAGPAPSGGHGSNPVGCARSRCGDAAGPSPQLGVPRISSLLPASGPVIGGEAMTIRGANFTPDAQVFFDNVQLHQVRWITRSELRVVTPPASTVITATRSTSLHDLRVAVSVRTAAGSSRLEPVTRYTYL